MTLFGTDLPDFRNLIWVKGVKRHQIVVIDPARQQEGLDGPNM